MNSASALLRLSGKINDTPLSGGRVPVSQIDHSPSASSKDMMPALMHTSSTGVDHATVPQALLSPRHHPQDRLPHSDSIAPHTRSSSVFRPPQPPVRRHLIATSLHQSPPSLLSMDTPTLKRNPIVESPSYHVNCPGACDAAYAGLFLMILYQIPTTHNLEGEGLLITTRPCCHLAMYQLRMHTPPGCQALL